jgi:Domain of unknown function (DUF4440)
MRRKVIVLLAVGFAALSGAVAQNHTEMQEPREVSQALQDLEHRWVEALVKADTRKLDDILGNRFVDTDEEGNRTDKRGVLGALKSGDLKMASIILSDMQVRAYRDSAVVTGAALQTGTFRGQPLVPRIVFTDTFVLENGNWRAVASHRSAVHSQ